MRYTLSLLNCFEGMDRKSFEMALELSSNSKGGLTSQYLAIRLSVKEEEIEYLYKHNSRLFFHDLSRIKLVPEAIPLVKRVQRGLTTNGDINSIFETLNGLSANEKRDVERRFNLSKVLGKMSLGMEIVDRLYRTPYAVVDFVAKEISFDLAREIFDYIWDSKTGVLPLNQIRQKFRECESEVDEAIEELLKNFAVFELFRYNGQDRLTRYVALLAEIRQLRENIRHAKEQLKQPIAPVKIKPAFIESQNLNFARKVSKVLASALLKPLHISSEGQLYKSDEQRILGDDKEDTPPSIHLSIWFAEKLGWLKQEGEYLLPAKIDKLLSLNLCQRQKMLFDFYTTSDEANPFLKTVLHELQSLQPLKWYSLKEFANRVYARYIDDMKYSLFQEGGNCWAYKPVGGRFSTENCINLMETYLFWFGIIDLCEYKESEYFCISELGKYMLSMVGAPLDSYIPQVEITVQHNFEIIAPTEGIDPLKLAIIESFAQKKSKGKISIYYISKESFLKGIQKGINPEIFLGILHECSQKRKPPELVISTIYQWAGSIKKVKLQKVILLETDNPVTAIELLHKKKFSGILNPPQNNHIIVSNLKDLAELKILIEKEGFVVEL